MSFTRVKLKYQLDVTHFTKNGVRNSSAFTYDEETEYQLLAGKPNTLFFVDIVQPGGLTTTDIQFREPLPRLPNNKEDFVFYVVTVEDKG